MTNHYGDGNPAHCCLPGAWDWYSDGINARLYSEPLPDRVITAASAANVDPHQLWDELEADGWEGHDSGLAEEAWHRAGAMKLWFNHRYPYLRRCIRSWCLRGQVYNQYCYKHNRY